MHHEGSCVLTLSGYCLRSVTAAAAAVVSGGRKVSLAAACLVVCALSCAPVCLTLFCLYCVWCRREWFTSWVW